MFLYLLFATLIASAHQGFINLNCEDAENKLVIVQMKKNSYRLTWTAGKSTKVKEKNLKLNIFDKVDPKTGQVIDNYSGSRGKLSFVIRRPETKGPQKAVTAKVMLNTDLQSHFWSECQVKF